MTTPWIKRGAWALAALVLLLAAAAGVFVATFDVHRYKSIAIDWMQTNRQRTLAIDGTIDLAVFPRPALKVSKLRLSERARDDQFLTVDEAALSLQWLPLLRRQLVIDRVSTRGVRALITRDAQALRNIDDLLAPSSPASSAGTATGAPPMRFEIGAMRLDAARVTLRDDLAQVSGSVSLDALSGHLASGQETPLDVRTTITLEKPQALRITLDGKAALTFDLDKGTASLRGAALKIGGDTEVLKAIDATLLGDLAWDGTRAQAGPIAVKLAGAKTGGVVLVASALDARRVAYSPATQLLELAALKLAVAGRHDKSSFDAELDWPRLAVTGERLDGSGFTGRIKLDGPTVLAGRFDSGAPSGNFEALRLLGFALKLDGSLSGNNSPRKIDVNLKSNLLLRPSRGSAVFERLELRANLTEPGLPALALDVGGNAGVDGRGAQWTLQGALNNNRFDSQGSAAFNAAVPALQVNARFDRLDLNQMLASNGAASAPAPAAPGDTPVVLDGLAALNGRFNLSAGQLNFRQYQIGDAKLDAALDNGALRITRLTGAAWGGLLEGSGSAEAKSKRITVKLAANGVNVNALLKDVAGKDLLEGRGRVSADVTTSGASLGALRSNLGGAAALQLREGSIKGVNLARTLRQAKAALSMKEDAITRAQASEQTDFSKLTASARISGGVATSDDLDLKSPFLRIAGAGRFDIGQGRIDYTARATVTGAPTGQDGAELAALRGVTVPVLLSGPFEAIDWKVQWSGVAAAALENKLKAQVKERLRGLFGK